MKNVASDAFHLILVIQSYSDCSSTQTNSNDAKFTVLLPIVIFVAKIVTACSKNLRGIEAGKRVVGFTASVVDR